MTTEILKLALEALEEPKEHFAKHRRLEAITAIKELLAQPEPEYIAFMDTPQRNPLSDEEIRKANHHMVEGAYDYSFKQGVKWAEYKHGIKE